MPRLQRQILSRGGINHERYMGKCIVNNRREDKMSRFTKGLFAVAGMSLCVSGTSLANDLTVVSWGGAYPSHRLKPITSHGWQRLARQSSPKITVGVLQK